MQKGSEAISEREIVNFWQAAARMSPNDEIEQKRLEWWKAFQPEIYKHTDRTRLPQDKLLRVQQYEHSARGLLFHGVSRRSKSRVMWVLMEKMWQENRSMKYRDDFEFSAQCSEAFRKGKELEWVDSMVRPSILFIDDLGKSKITERVGQGLFQIVEKRAQQLKPIFITTNFIGQELINRFQDEQTAIPFVERLREFCETIQF